MRCSALAAALLFVPLGVAEGGECNALTPADVKAVTGVDVQAPPAGEDKGHGCSPYKQTDGQPYLVVERRRGPDTYRLEWKQWGMKPSS
jgi:hypothetical protein